MKPITALHSNATCDGSHNHSLIVRLSLHFLRAYKLLLSPYFAGCCRFLPSCADYAAEAIAAHGIVRGYWLTAMRLARCHPLGAAGYDPVPAKAKSR